MKKTVIYYFTGTGNTLRICKLFKERLETAGIEVKLSAIQNSNAETAAEFDAVGIAYPVHAFNAPEPVLRFANGLPECKGKYTFVIKTSGEPLKLNDASSCKLNSVLSKSGYKTGVEFHYVMPYNILFRHSDGMAAMMLETAKQRIQTDAIKVLEQSVEPTKINFVNKIAVAAFRIEQPFVKINGRLFSANPEKCNGCGKCARKCPCSNITMSEGKPYFGKNCSGCMRCAFLCPYDAVKTGLLQPVKINGAYDFEPSELRDVELPNYCRRSYEDYFGITKKM